MIRIAAVFILLFALLGVGSILPVYAQSGVPTQCAYGAAPGGAFFCNQQQAFERCTAMAEYGVSQSPHNRSARACVLSGSNRYFCSVNEAGRQYPLECELVGSSPGWSTYWYFSDCDAAHPWDEATKTCKEPKVCDSKGPPLSGGFMKYEGSEPPYQTCSDGCEYNPSSMTYQAGTVDGIQYVSISGWIPSGASCTVGPNDGYVPPSDSDGDGVSDGNDNAPNNPGDSSSPNDPSKPKGDTKNDGDGSGNGNQSSGGGNCGSPPSSSGDQILAQIAYQSWATRCAIESAKNADGSLKTSSGSGSGGDQPGQGGGGAQDQTNGLLTSIRDYVKKVADFFDGISSEVSGLDTDPGLDEDATNQVWGESAQQEDLDSGGLGWGRACPVLPTISGPGYSGSIDDGALCTVMQALGALVLLLAYFQAGIIIGRS